MSADDSKKHDVTDISARRIAATETAVQSGKTSRLRETRLKQPAADATKPEEPAPGKTGKNVR